MSLLCWYEHRAKVNDFLEVDWLNGRHPLTLLAYLRMRTDVCRTKRGRRKLRLFACACARRYWNLIAQHPWKKGLLLQEGVEWAERFADGEIDREAFENAVAEAREEGQGINVGVFAASFMAGQAAHPAAFEGAWEVARLGPLVAGRWEGEEVKCEQAAQCDLLREVVGNPFRRVLVDPSWLRWNGGTIRNLAQPIYADRAFDRMPILADALEDAGCEDRALLEHCRSPGPHVRGCWALDLLLGKG
ncbi:MAG TPA: hypothetical protein VKD72_28180 [Gemmataceae bacterium]|nr:hypothetical protein [Gemmataceae bacterium]